MASITLNPSGYVSCGATSGTATISNQTNPVGKGSSNTTYASLTHPTSASSTAYAFWSFDCSSIPSNATIDSVTCTAKCGVSSTSTNRTASRAIQLYNGTSTAKGSSVTWTANTSGSTATISSTNAGTWTRDELNNIYIRVSNTRGTSTQSLTVYFYGADLTITYTENEQQFTVTINSSGTGTTTPTGAQSVTEGDDLLITLIPDDEDTNISITDNGVDVSTQLVNISGGTSQSDAGDTHEVSSVPASYSTSGSISGTAYQNAIGNGSDYTSNTSNVYCQTSGSTAYIDYTFDFSSIPSDAIITSIEAIATGHCESTSQSTEVADIQLYCNGTAKGTKSSFTSTSNTAVTLDAGEWTREELNNLTLRFTVGYYGGLMSGATIKVIYMELGEAGVGYTYNVSNVSENHTINIVYSEGVVTMYTVNTSISNGTLINPSETVEVRSGRSVDFSFKGDDKAKFVSMTVNGVSVTPTRSTGQDSTTATWSVSTNYSVYNSYAITNINSDTSNYFWSSEAQADGKYVLFTFNKLINLTGVTTYSSNSTDYPHSCNKLQASADGNTWTDLGTFSDAQTSTFTGLNANKIKYVRIYCDGTGVSNWLVINTVTFTYTTPSITAGYSYTLSNITEDKTVVITFAGNNKVTLKINGAWKQGTPYKKVDGTWTTVTPQELAAYLEGKTIIKK